MITALVQFKLPQPVTRDKAQETWGNYIRDKYGAPPSVTYFESPVIVDNLTREIVSDPKA